MVKNLPIWLFLSISLILIGTALLPLLRVTIGIDSTINLPFTTVVMLFIGGLMSGLTAMILLVRRVPQILVNSSELEPLNSARRQAVALHATGLLLYTGIPLLNFFVAYFLWNRYRRKTARLHVVARDVLNFQITVYLYLLLSLFMVFAAIGVVTTPLILLLHLLATILAIILTTMGKSFNYPANIPIIQGRRPAATNNLIRR